MERIKLDQLLPSVDHSISMKPDRFLEAAMHGRRFDLPDKAQDLYRALGNDSRFKLSDPGHVVEAVRELFQKDTKGKTADLLDALSKQVGIDNHVLCASESHIPAIDGFKKQAESAGKRASGIYDKWNLLPAERRLDVGIFGVSALLGAFSSIRNARNSVYKDSDGNRHVEWSNASIALLQGALSVGCACLAVQALRSGHGY